MIPQDQVLVLFVPFSEFLRQLHDGSPLGICASDQLPEAARVVVRPPVLLFPE